MDINSQRIEPYAFLPNVQHEINDTNNSSLYTLNFEEDSICSIVSQINIPDQLTKASSTAINLNTSTWSLSYKMNESGDLIYALFSSFGIYFWFPYQEKVIHMTDSGFVKNNMACFGKCGDSVALLYLTNGGKLFLVPDCYVNQLVELNLKEKIRCMGSITDGKFAIVTESKKLFAINIEEKSIILISNNRIYSLNPFRKTAFYDSLMFITDDSFAYSVSYNHFSVFQKDTLENVGSVSIPYGIPVSISIVEDCAFILIMTDKPHEYVLINVVNIFTEPIIQLMKNISLETEKIGLVAIAKDMCCIYQKWTMMIFICNEKIQSLSLNVSNSFDDTILTANSFEIGTISIFSLKSCYYKISILPFEKIIKLMPEQLKIVEKAFNFFKKSKISKAFDLLHSTKPNAISFSRFDHNMLMKFYDNVIEDHLTLIQMYNMYTKEINDDFEINIYEYICLKEIADYLEDHPELYEIGTYSNNKDLKSILNTIKLDIKEGNFQILELLIIMIQECFNHSDTNRYLYSQKVNMIPEITEIIDLSLSKFLESPNIYDIEQYSQLCEFSLKIKNDENNLKYAMELINHLPERCEEIGKKYHINQLLAQFIHHTSDYSKVEEYYRDFGEKCIESIMLYLYENNFVSDILEIGTLKPLHKLVSIFIRDRYDLLVQAFNAISDNPEELETVSLYLWETVKQGIKDDIYTLDQASTLCSIALICCFINENNENLRDEIQSQFNLFELQKLSGIEEKILSSESLIEYLLEQNDSSIALCAYSFSFKDHNDKLNGKLLASIIYHFIQENGSFDKVEELPLQELFSENNLIQKIPNSFRDHLKKLITNNNIVDKIMNIFNNLLPNNK